MLACHRLSMFENVIWSIVGLVFSKCPLCAWWHHWQGEDPIWTWLFQTAGWPWRCEEMKTCAIFAISILFYIILHIYIYIHIYMRVVSVCVIHVITYLSDHWFYWFFWLEKSTIFWGFPPQNHLRRGSYIHHDKSVGQDHWFAPASRVWLKIAGYFLFTLVLSICWRRVVFDRHGHHDFDIPEGSSGSGTHCIPCSQTCGKNRELSVQSIQVKEVQYPQSVTYSPASPLIIGIYGHLYGFMHSIGGYPK